jgi:hypothetical protein
MKIATSATDEKKPIMFCKNRKIHMEKNDAMMPALIITRYQKDAKKHIFLKNNSNLSSDE